jgi:proteasome accessory factor A
MADRLMGVETEYAIAGIRPEGGGVDRAALVDDLIAHARERLPHVPDWGAGQFLTNGSRLYVDYGLHPELSTPECDNPWDVVRYILAGERILAELAERVEWYEPHGCEVMLFKNNVDYSDSRTTWGCHESYLCKAPDSLARQIIPHLVSRVIYTGAGGFNPFSSGLEFTLSPRSHHLSCEVANNSTCERGIFHNKDESLSGGDYHRIHLICGESICSETAMWLKMATTALVVAMAEARACPAQEVALSSPLSAMRTFASDPLCKKRAALANGNSASAIDIQRHYLEHAQVFAREPFMPPWAEEACARWSEMLDRLERGPESVETTLDWAIKLALYKDMAKQRGIAWDTLGAWTRVLSELRAGLADSGYYEQSIAVHSLLGPFSPIRKQIKTLNPYMKQHGLKWDDLNSILSLRQDLFEIDVKFSRVGAKGIFASLDAAGVLTHHVPGVDRIGEAASEPPAAGRAAVRGRVIREVASSGRDYVADWQGIWDKRNRRVLDLSDPFEKEERWSKVNDPYSDYPFQSVSHVLESLAWGGLRD